ncbi:MAG: tetratricopeptide repeat protein, partial [Chloroflexota bacterium]|nr:tetratricopeptide repeat protein [Chloroflexota bacterium]
NQSAIEKAVTLYRQALREVPDSIELATDTAKLLARLGRRPEAVEVLADLEIRVPPSKRDPRVKGILKSMKSM